MAKSKNSKPKTRNVEVDNINYPCTFKNGKITVYAPRTAPGQKLIAGTFDPINDEWTNESKKVPLSKMVKKKIKEELLK